MSTISSFPITADAISALPVVTTTINTTDKFPFVSSSTTSYCTFQTIINNLATSYQPLNANLTQIAQGTAPTQAGLDLLAIPTPSSNSFISILTSGAIQRRTFVQVLADIAAQPASLALTALSVLGEATTAGKNILLVPNPSGFAGYLNVTSAGAAASVKSYQTVANDIRPFLIPPAVNKGTTGTTLTPAFDTADFWALTALASGLTINAPTGSNYQEGSILTLRLADNGSTRALTWNAIYKTTTGAGGTLPTATGGKTNYLQFMYNSTDTSWDCLLFTQK